MTRRSMMVESIGDAELGMFAAIEAQREALIERLLAWSAINSGSRNLDGLARMADPIARMFDDLGGTLTLRDPAPVEAIDAAGNAVPLRHGRNIHFVARSTAPLRVVMIGHMDTVFPADHPFQAPRWKDAGVINGPGVADMKGGLLVMITALRAFLASGLAPHLGIEVIVNSDEEVSSLGSAALIDEVASRCQIGLGYEPSFLPDGTLAGARKGSGNFSVTVRGTAAHAGRNPEDGRNALVAAADFVLQLSALNGQRPGLTVNPARIDGGSANNVVPDLAVVRFNARVADPFDQGWLETEIAGRIGQLERTHGVTMHLHGGFARPPKPLDNHQLALFNLVRRCGETLAQPIAWRESGGVCDGNNLAARGLAVVDTLGVRGGAIHSGEEYMFVDSLVERACLSALLLARLARGEWGGPL